MTDSDNLRANLDGLEDAQLTYVLERSLVLSDKAGYENAGIPRSTFYGWDELTREALNAAAQELKRHRLLAVEKELEENARLAVRVLVRLLNSKNESIRKQAAAEILDRTVARKHDITSDGEPLSVLVHYVDDWRGRPANEDREYNGD